MRFRNRIDAGTQLAERLLDAGLEAPVVLALPRGGVPVAWVVAKRLGAALDVFVARKVGAPGHEELGIGAVAEGSDETVWSAAASQLGLSETALDELAERTRADVRRRLLTYRGTAAPPAITDKDVVLVDDGLATGVTAEAALRSLRKQQPRRLVLAVPVGAAEAVSRLGQVADEVVCVLTPETFFAVGEWYDDFRQTTDEEVRDLLRPV